MALNVISFFTKGNLRVNQNSTLSDNDFCILVEREGVISEFLIHVPKHFSFIPSDFNPLDFKLSKLHEYNVLVDSLNYRWKAICSEWNLTEKEFEELMTGINIYLIKEFYKGKGIKKFFMLLGYKLRLKVLRLLY